ncbi:MAG TPA: aldo/keto reductase [Polyangiaceae bacterium]|nr:aldo/keto reductase [Polyangiaceae bacterium]
MTRIVQGVAVPSIFYGTAWKEERTAELTQLALEAGFSAIDTANQRKHYFEAAVGQAVARSRTARSELFLQSKFTYVRGQDHRLPYDPKAPFAEQVRQSLASSLEHLGTDYLDSYILHGPASHGRLVDADWEVWSAMEELQRANKVRLLGVSNVELEQLRALCEKARPAFVQNRCYASHGWDREVREFCRDNDVVYQGFSLLTANRAQLTAPPVTRAAARTGRTAAQVIFAFAKQVGMIPLTGTSDPTHMKQDLERFELRDDEVTAIERICG